VNNFYFNDNPWALFGGTNSGTFLSIEDLVTKIQRRTVNENNGATDLTYNAADNRSYFQRKMIGSILFTLG